MVLFRKLFGLLFIGAAALAGNWTGDRLRATAIGEPQREMRLVHKTADGATVVGLNIALTNFIPALIVALLSGRPRPLYAFLSGLIISTLVGDVYERTVLRHEFEL